MRKYSSVIIKASVKVQEEINMTNNDILIRLRYALDIKNVDMAEIFNLGGMSFSKEEVMNMLIKVKEDEEAPENFVKVNNKMLEAFLNGFITFKRGPQKDADGNVAAPNVTHIAVILGMKTMSLDACLNNNPISSNTARSEVFSSVFIINILVI